MVQQLRRAGLPAIGLIGALLGLTAAGERRVDARTEGTEARTSSTNTVAAPQGGPTLVTPATIDKLTAELAGKYGESERPRFDRGIKQAAQFWRKEDGDEAAFAEVVRSQVTSDSKAHNALFARMEFAFESLDGHMNEIARDFRRQSDLDLGPIYPFDEILAGYDPSAHVVDDFFANKLAFVVLLNFPLTTLEQRLTDGEHWSRRQWAEARLAERFGKRVPADVQPGHRRGAAATPRATSPRYNIWMHHLVDAKGERLFPAEAAAPLALEPARRDQGRLLRRRRPGSRKQRMIAKVMDRIVTQTIPAVVVDNPHVDWDPVTNAVERRRRSATPTWRPRRT